ncbi:hypothetical protein [Ostreibacterium oceani]|uniref:Uncharacterized protein n=1 Tax=Ostreibacterium oceani TaxID=2654998 RepID=A0A6N7ESY9_9GAMM|nr:hypothetical protein [Ostreibacterium oceani]MPV85661.1 hypothetical protein [Ostreibacterium oceani]
MSKLFRQFLGVEIVSDNHVRLYDGINQTVRIIDDAALFEMLGVGANGVDMGNVDSNTDYHRTDVYLFDSLFITSKRFTQPVQDDRLLEKIIPAAMEKDLLHGVEAYTFAHARVQGGKVQGGKIQSDKSQGDMWVSWIEKARIDTLKQRFSQIRPRVKGLYFLPLGWQLLPPTDLHTEVHTEANTEANTHAVYEYAPLIYVVSSEEIMAMEAAPFEAWARHLSLTPQPMVDLAQYLTQNLPQNLPQNLAQGGAGLFDALQPSRLKSLPNLWPTQQQSAKKRPIRRWLMLGGLIIASLTGNALFSYQQAQTALSAVTAEQATLLKQVLPNARPDDPYTRMQVAQRQISSHALQKLIQLDALFGQGRVEIDRLSVDLSVRQVTLVGVLDEAVQTALTESGFLWQQAVQQNVQQNGQQNSQQWVITW